MKTMFDPITDKSLRWSLYATALHVTIYYNLLIAENPWWSVNPWW